MGSGWMERVLLALPIALAVGCGGEEAPEAMRQGPPQEDAGMGTDAYVDPQGRFTLLLPDGLALESVLDGDRLLFTERATGAPILEAELTEVDREALQWVPREQHGGDLFVAHVLFRAAAVCAADGPEGTQHCSTTERFEEISTPGGAPRTVRFEPILTSEHFPTRTRADRTIGPFWAAHLPAARRSPGHSFLLVPTGRSRASEPHRALGDAVIQGLRPRG
jgi:hypothetical protein